MIDPKEFLNKKEEVQEDFRMKIGGAFKCFECGLTNKEALLDEDKGLIYWTCANGHESEARIR